MGNGRIVARASRITVSCSADRAGGTFIGLSASIGVPFENMPKLYCISDAYDAIDADAVMTRSKFVGL